MRAPAISAGLLCLFPAALLNCRGAQAPATRCALYDLDAPAAQPAEGEPTPEFKAARSLAGTRRWSSAAEALWPIVEGEVGSSEAEVQEAQFMLAVTEYRLGDRHDAQTIFTVIVEQPQHRRRKDAADWLCREYGGETVELTNKQRVAFGVAGAESPPDGPPGAPREAVRREGKKAGALPDCSAMSCQSGDAASVCWNIEKRVGTCECGYAACDPYADNSWGPVVVLCATETDCFAPPNGMVLVGCDEPLGTGDGVPEGTLSCSYRPQMTEYAQTPAPNCSTLQACAHECRKGDAGACEPLLKLAEKTFKDEADPKGAAKAIPYFMIACQKGHAQSCMGLGYAYGSGTGVARSFKSSAKYFGKACDVTGEDDECIEAKWSGCVAETWTPARRSPAMDRYCNPVAGRPGKGPVKAYSPADPTKGVEWDECSPAMRAVGCTETSSAKLQRSAYCCR